MKLLINGQRHSFEAPTSIEALIEHFKLTHRRVAVERNRQIVPKGSYAQTMLADGDQLEIVTLVGGG